MNTNSLTSFKNENFGEIRSVLIDNEPYFIAMDIARVLGYATTEKMIRRLDEDEVLNYAPSRGVLFSKHVSSIKIINESGLYNAILGSKKLEAKKFKKWVTSEVLPSIRKTGEYKLQQNQYKIPNTYAEALLEAARMASEKEKLEHQLEIAKPKIALAESIEKKAGSISISDFARILKDQNNTITQRKVFDYLYKNNYIFRKGNGIKPYREYLEKGLFEVSEVSIPTTNGNMTFITTRLTGKGQLELAHKLKEYFVKDRVNPL